MDQRAEGSLEAVDPAQSAALAAKNARRARIRLRIRREAVSRSAFATAAMFFLTGAVFGTWAGQRAAADGETGRRTQRMRW